jgi:hypothetical protein
METQSEISEDIHLVTNNPESVYLQDHMRFHLMSAKLECEHNRDAFWRTYRKFKRKSNWLSVPLLIVSSATGITSVTSVSQLNQLTEHFEVAPILAAIFGVGTAVLSGLQKYFRYSERAENCKYVAKSYNRLSKRIKNTMAFIHSDFMKITPNGLYKFMDDINKEIISLSREIDEQPLELIKPRQEHVKVMQELKEFYVKNHPMKKGETTIEIPATIAEIEI